MLNNFTSRAQQVLALARRESDRFNHNYVGTEHLLLGIIKLAQGTAVETLHRMGFDLETIRQQVEKITGQGPETKMVGNIPYTPRVKKVLALAGKEAKALNHQHVGTEHILIGLVKEDEGVAARVLIGLGVTYEEVVPQVLAVLQAYSLEVEPGPDADFQALHRIEKGLRIAAEARAQAAEAKLRQVAEVLSRLQASMATASQAAEEARRIQQGH